jgi:hypothetical protein
MKVMSRTGFILGALAAAAAAAIFLFWFPREVPFSQEPASPGVVAEQAALPAETEPEPAVPPPPAGPQDLPFQPRLADPPVEAKAIYVTGWVAGSQNRMKALMDLVDRTDLNAVVIDIKDYSGYVSYKMDVPEVRASGADREPRMLYPNRLIKELHDRNIYVIGRITIFQDSILAAARPEWALQTEKGDLWRDRKGLAWMDPAAKPVWDYNLAIAKDALARGFDEINFDYIRFPSDGDLKAIRYTHWDETGKMREVIERFFRHVRQELGSARTSADLFGLATLALDDLGIGQVIEDAYGHFDYIAPMVYPSHYAAGFIGYKNPAQYPYEVIRHSLAIAAQRLDLKAKESEGVAVRTRLRPWLQAFDLGAVYDSSMIAAQIRAADEIKASHPDLYAGWFLWDPSNRYQHYAD